MQTDFESFVKACREIKTLPTDQLEQLELAELPGSQMMVGSIKDQVLALKQQIGAELQQRRASDSATASHDTLERRHKENLGATNAGKKIAIGALIVSLLSLGVTAWKSLFLDASLSHQVTELQRKVSVVESALKSLQPQQSTQKVQPEPSKDPATKFEQGAEKPVESRTETARTQEDQQTPTRPPQTAKDGQ